MPPARGVAPGARRRRRHVPKSESRACSRRASPRRDAVHRAPSSDHAGPGPREAIRQSAPLLSSARHRQPWGPGRFRPGPALWTLARHLLRCRHGTSLPSPSFADAGRAGPASSATPVGPARPSPFLGARWPDAAEPSERAGAPERLSRRCHGALQWIARVLPSPALGFLLHARTHMRARARASRFDKSDSRPPGRRPSRMIPPPDGEAGGAPLLALMGLWHRQAEHLG